MRGVGPSAWIVWIVAAFYAQPGLAAAARVDIPCTDDGSARTVELSAPAVEIGVDAGARWLEIEEDGQSIAVVGETDSPRALTQPLRFGWHWIPVDKAHQAIIKRVERSPAEAHIRVRVHCLIPDSVQTQLAWLQQASAWTDQSARSLDDAIFADFLRRIDALIDAAPNAQTRAFALHMRAQLFNANGRAADAATAFEAARGAWVSLGDNARATAALAGEVGAWYRTGNYAAILAHSEEPKRLAANPSYFGVRLQNTRCLSLQALSRLAEAGACYSWVLAQCKRLGETAEGVATLQNYASLLRDSGKSDEALRIGEEALASATGSDAPMVRGRIHVMLADLALRRGDINASLVQSDLALAAFADATQDVRRWQANVYLQVASLFLQLGAPSEAYEAIGESVKRISSRDAPARMALAMQTFAAIETSERHFQSALVWQQAAENVYAHLNMPAALNSVRLARMRVLLQTDSLADVERELADAGPMGAPYAGRLALVQAELAIRRQRLAEARAAIDVARNEPMSMSEQVRLLRLSAQAQALSGDPSGAQTTLIDGAMRLRDLAAEARSGVLQFLLEQQTAPLRTTGIEIVLQQSEQQRTSTQSAQQVWNWLAPHVSSAGRSTPNPATQQHAEQFDSAIADSLLKPEATQKTTADSAAQRALLSIVAGARGASGGASASTASTLSIEALQRQIPSDTVVLAYAAGDTQGALIAIDSEQIQLVEAATPAVVDQSISLARAALRSASTPIAEIDSALQTVATNLLGALRGKNPPRRLWIVEDDRLAGVPWAALTWPGQARPLIETTSVSLIRPSREEPSPASASPAELQIVIASQLQPDGPLAALADADAEPRLIAAALENTGVKVIANKPSSRNRVLAALTSSGSWVHVAAHGWTQPSRLGYSGIWLDADRPDAAPGFLSWLEILESGVRADLVVLNACSLSNRGDASSNNLSFAGAVSRAGAKNVVAALWSMSDSATAVWVPAFYRAMTAPESHDVSDALRDAQKSLRQTRSFSHPFYWAGLQVETRLGVEAPVKQR